MLYKNDKKQKTLLGNVTEFILLLMLVFLVRTVGFGLYQVPSGSMETTMLVGERFFADKFTYWIRKPQRNEIIAINDPEYKYSTNPFVHFFEQYVWGPSNWTKRIIGIPGDTVRGVIEDGKPVVYLNGTKLEEPYLNKYPLIRVWTEDPEVLKAQIEQELHAIMRNRSFTDQAMLERVLMQKWAGKTSPRSYDPESSLQDQPFYRLKESRIIRGEDGKPELLYPGTPINTANELMTVSGKRHWNKSDVFYVELGEDDYWCMGDNRLGSKDSRFLGPYKGKYIHARISARIWSVDSDEDWAILDLIKHPIDIWSRVRFSRFFQWIY